MNVNDDTTVIRDKSQAVKEIVTASAAHIGTRDYQQDSLFVTDSVSFTDSDAETAVAFGVLCDGMGGLENGSEASAMAVSGLTERLSALDGSEDVPTALREEIAALNTAVCERFGAGSAGTTLVAAYLEEDLMYWASVGDSRVYLLRGDAIMQLSRDHNLALLLAWQVELGEMSIEEANSHASQEALVSYLGAPELKMIDGNSEPIELEHGDVVLLCSDGLTKSLSPAAVFETIAANRDDIAEAARQLTLAAFETGGAQDNTSVILMKYLE
jgi:protein phosphatase